MAAYKGHRSWNAWNVALWIGLDEDLCQFAMECLEDASVNKAARTFMQEFEGTKTPDGARYNYTCVREALAGLKE